MPTAINQRDQKQMTDQVPPASISSDPIDAAMAAAAAPKAPTPQPTSETPVESSLEGEKLVPEVPERAGRAAAKAADAKRRAAESEKRARQLSAEAKAEREAIQKQKAELDSLLSGAKESPDNIKKLLAQAGLSIDDIARAYLDLGPEEPSVNDIARQANERVEALQKQLDEERKDKADADSKAKMDLVYNDHITKVHSILTEDQTDKFELVKSYGAEGERVVLNRAYKFLRDNDYTDPTPEDEVLLVQHIATQLEAELIEEDEQRYQRAIKNSKLRAKLGIIDYNNTGSNESRSNNDIASMDPDHQKVLETLTKETTANPVRSNRFLTNDTTVSARPSGSVVNTYASDSEREIDELVKAYQGK